MKKLLFAALATVGVFAGVALGQQDDTQPPPEPVPAEVPDVLDAQNDTDLGNSVDDLLANLPATAPQEAETPTGNPGEVPAENVTDAFAEGFEGFEDFEEEIAPLEITYDQYSNATLRALDKITGRSTDIQVQTDRPIVFGSLNIEMKTCFQTPPELPPESAAFLSIKSTQSVQVETMEDAVDATDVSTVSEDNPKLFSGWMFASSPGLSALEHPVYDVWVIKCNAA